MTKTTLRCFGLLALGMLSGCFSPWFARDVEQRSEMGARREAIKERLEQADRPTIINQIGSPMMLTLTRLENIGLVTQLPGTGGEVNASQQREKMLDTMRRADAYEPAATLDAPSTALVVVTTAVPPAARKGDRLDVLVNLSSHANATDLQHGLLLETGLMEMSILGGQVREGFDLAKAQGRLVTLEQRTGDEDPRAKTEGIIVGGARLLKGRELGIGIDAEFADAVTMGAIVPVINKRFTYFNGRKETGIATPREDSYLEIAVPRKYRDDPFHFLNVVLRIGFNESDEQRSERFATLSERLREPTTVREACWELEAMGEQGIPLLATAIDNPNPEIAFYAAHSLAYLNDKRAVPKLTALCHKEPAFRAMCLNGLVAIEDYSAGDALKELIHAANPEVKYGAVLAVRRRDSSDAEVTGREIGGAGSLLEIPSQGPPLVVVSLTETPELVLFGSNPQLQIPTFQYVNPEILVSPNDRGGLTVSRFQTGEEDQIVESKPDLRSALEAIAEVGGTYGDWVKFVRESHENGYFIEPFAMNPVPNAGRKYERQQVNREIEPGDSLYEQTMIHLDDEQAEEDEAESKRPWYKPFSTKK